MTSLRIVLRVIRPYLWALPILIFLGLLSSLAEGIGIGLMIPLFGALFQTEPSTDSGWMVGLFQQYGAGLAEEWRLILLVGTILGMIGLKSVVQYSYEALSYWFNAQAIYSIRRAVFRQLLEVGHAFLARQGSGQLFNTIHNEIWRAGELLTVVSWMMISSCVIVVLVVLLLLISWQLTLMAAAGVAVVALLVRLAARRARRFGVQTVDAHEDLSKRALEALNGMRVIRLFGREALEDERFERAAERARFATLRVDLAGALVRSMTEFLYAPIFLGTLLVAWHFGLDLATLLAFLVLLYRVQPHIRRLDSCRVQLAGFAPSISEIAALLDRSDKPYIRSGSRPFPGLTDRITFDRVSFHYDTGEEDRLAVEDVSFEIGKDEVVALVGGSGAGKSTIINLLCRFYDPTAGTILVDGVPLNELKLSDWRSRLAFAGQDIELMGDTVLENIAYGSPGADRDAVIAAAKQADAHDFIMALPEGYDSNVGDRGLRLSAGQRQRIGLARALLRAPDILILDEATSALDSVSEGAIQETLERLTGRLTILVIAHRLSTIRQAHRVVVLEAGRLVEEGRPEELLRRDGRFAQLWRLQGTAFDGIAGVGAEAEDGRPAARVAGR